MSTPNGCVVLTAPLTRAVCDFLTRWGRDIVSPDDHVLFIDGIEWIAFESGLPEETIRNIKRGRHRTTELSVADRLVQALGHPEWFHDGTLTIAPNRNAPRHLRDECCGGSADAPAPAEPLAAA